MKKMMMPLFLATVLLCIGMSSANPGAGVAIQPVGQTHSPIFQMTLPSEVLIKWKEPLIALLETFTKEGLTSENTHRELFRFIFEIFLDRGFIGYGYPAGVEFPCLDYSYIRVYDTVVITDNENFLNVVPYDDSYAPLLKPEPEATMLVRGIIVFVAEAIINIVVKSTTSVS